jgi:transposase
MKGYLMNKQIKTLNFEGQDFFIGIDVHLKSWKVTIRNNDMVLKAFSMDPNPDQLHSYLQKNYPKGHYFSVYESGYCGYWIHRRLRQLGINNIVVNPADVPTTHKEKNQKRDPIDSRKLSRELENNSLTGIFIPTPQQQALRSISRLYFQNVGDRTRLKLRIKSFLYYQGVELPRMDQMHHWSGRFIHWVKLISFENKENSYHLHQLLLALEQKRQQCTQILKYARESLKDIPIINFLRSVCGIGFITAFTLYAELMDMRRFSNTDKLCSFIGLVPSVEASGETEKIKGLTNRHNKFLRNRIVEAAWVAVRTDPALTQSFNELTKRMAKQKAIIRIARKLLSRIRYVWLNEKIYVTGVVS